ncbi:prepilin-type N-terminal cleavage/methylation domain-containing protein [Clostridium ganghwense]|uniref:Prepilin-type N-terminal cleavage/methylation domain-containing protein n=1 Tax=Clostridium ganghwense TaxID=312089 RepID=A0ABT4CPG1_9CLOT|nr:prepilin-type N-terminal cleavage/methylation domain-containing protein [Clostridium ganghwense]MCY6370333.1 prepilin-type N-terminal cleavage/methylation domain-containing protein [Clostridium ganghwense]
MNKKKGTTLIEVVIVLSIISILSGISITNCYGIYNSTLNSFNVDICNNSILHIINDSKQYCKGKNKTGYLVFDSRSITFHCGLTVKSYEMPKEFKLESINTSSGKQLIYIDNLGNTSDACTITYKDRKGKNHFITLRVGTNYVQIK